MQLLRGLLHKSFSLLHRIHNLGHNNWEGWLAWQPCFWAENIWKILCHVCVQINKQERDIFLPSLHWEDWNESFSVLCFTAWTSKIIEWMFPLWVRFWDQSVWNTGETGNRYTTIIFYFLSGRRVVVITQNVDELHKRAGQFWIMIYQ